MIGSIMPNLLDLHEMTRATYSEIGFGIYDGNDIAIAASTPVFMLQDAIESIKVIK
jgi:hypothetical protein